MGVCGSVGVHVGVCNGVSCVCTYIVCACVCVCVCVKRRKAFVCTVVTCKLYNGVN